MLYKQINANLFEVKFDDLFHLQDVAIERITNNMRSYYGYYSTDDAKENRKAVNAKINQIFSDKKDSFYIKKIDNGYNISSHYSHYDIDYTIHAQTIVEVKRLKRELLFENINKVKQNKWLSLFKKKKEQKINGLINHHFTEYMNYIKQKFEKFYLDDSLFEELKILVLTESKNDLNKVLLLLDDIVESISLFLQKISKLEKATFDECVFVMNKELTNHFENKIINGNRHNLTIDRISKDNLKEIEQLKKELF